MKNVRRAVLGCFAAAAVVGAAFTAPKVLEAQTVTCSYLTCFTGLGGKIYCHEKPIVCPPL